LWINGRTAVAPELNRCLEMICADLLAGAKLAETQQ